MINFCEGTMLSTVDIGEVPASSKKQKLNMNKMVKLNFSIPTLESYYSWHLKVDHLKNLLRSLYHMDGRHLEMKKLFGMM